MSNKKLTLVQAMSDVQILNSEAAAIHDSETESTQYTADPKFTAEVVKFVATATDDELSEIRKAIVAVNKERRGNDTKRAQLEPLRAKVAEIRKQVEKDAVPSFDAFVEMYKKAKEPLFKGTRGRKAKSA